MSDIVLDNVKDRILDLVVNINPHDALEQQHINDTAAWIKSGEQIFRISKPDNPNKHLVSYFVMFDQAKEKILLVDHKKAELWLPPGGHVEIDEDPIDTVTRECMEELSVAAEFWSKKPIFITQTVTVGKTAGHTDVSLWYVIKGNSNIEYDYDREEFSNIKWFSLDEVPYDLTDPHMERFINKLKNIRQQPVDQIF
jgi:8-oxo-dGTP pyrophosphatase MutT (NUDIX family)